MAYYPYLQRYFANEKIKGKRVLEIGLGYGTLGQVLVENGCDYYGVDIALNPVLMMRYRLSLLGQESERVQVSSAVHLPYKSETFDLVYSIGCLHHTGDLDRCVSEVHRVLRPYGKAVIMLYNGNSFRRYVRVPLKYCNMLLKSLILKKERKKFSDFERALYDDNLKGEEAPYTDFVSRGKTRKIFGRFSSTRIECQNFDPISIRGRTIIPRAWLLSNAGRVAGLDLYVVAVK
ncbi:MAG: class I SAM-dependent methyltransferase [Pseudomonadota bacterium]